MLNEDVLYLIYKNLHKITIIPELQYTLQRRNVLKALSFEKKTASRIATEASVTIQFALEILNQSYIVKKKFNNLYNIMTYKIN
jgi:hypothetical protein